MIQMQWNIHAKVTSVIAGNNLQNIWMVLCGRLAVTYISAKVCAHVSTCP
jgi:hypothetical protein